MKERGDTLPIQHPQWGDGARKVALVMLLMSQARSIGVFDSAHLLHLAVGGSILFIRGGGLSYYKRGRFKPTRPNLQSPLIYQEDVHATAASVCPLNVIYRVRPFFVPLQHFERFLKCIRGLKDF